jgi:hypothetical protein
LSGYTIGKGRNGDKTMTNLTDMFWNEHFRNVEVEKLKGLKLRIYNWLNKDNFGGFVLDGNIFWIEKTVSTATLPNYIYAYLKKWATKKGYTALYTA